jgi:hypothetical protein
MTPPDDAVNCSAAVSYPDLLTVIVWVPGSTTTSKYPLLLVVVVTGSLVTVTVAPAIPVETDPS